MISNRSNFIREGAALEVASRVPVSFASMACANAKRG